MNQPNTDISNSLSRKLLVIVLLCMSIFAMFITAVQLYFDYGDELHRIDNRLAEIENSHAESISTSLWLVDRGQVDLQVKGILAMPDIEYVKIDVPDDMDYEQGIQPTVGNARQRVFKLEYKSQDKLHNLGALTVVASTKDLDQRMNKHAVFILITQFFKILLLSILILGVFKYLVTRHLATMANYVRGLGIDSLDKVLKLDRKSTLSNQNDELSKVVNAINDMRGQLIDDVHRRESIERALISSKEKFETLYNKNPSMYFTVSVDGTLISVNDFGARQLGYEPHDIMGQPVSTIYQNGSNDSVTRVMDLSVIDENKLHRRDVTYIHRQGRPVRVREVARAVKNELGEKQILLVSEDISEAHELSKQLNYQSTHDGLTGLLNRKEFDRKMTAVIHGFNSNEVSSEYALLYIDLDQFKIINDTCGHLAGDELIRRVAGLLSEHMREGDILARLGGDEFGVLLGNCSPSHALVVAKGFCSSISDMDFTWGGSKYKVTTSIGLVVIDENIASCSAALIQADNACYVAKDLGRNRVHVYSQDDTELSKRVSQMQWVSRIESALEQDRFEIYLQCIAHVDQTGSGSKHYEVLLRMHSEDGSEVIPPGAFLSAAEQYNLMLKIDMCILAKTFYFLRDNPSMLDNLEKCSINLSGQTLMETSFIDYVLQMFEETAIPPQVICFEVTETAAIANLSKAYEFITVLKEKGCKFSLDDFGSGLSSFGYLKSLPVDYVKIDGMFVRDMVNDPIDFAMVRSINEVAQIMGKKTVAEFVETQEVMEALRKIGVDYAQGYLVDKPKPAQSYV